jgi:hypothetical protein
MESLPRCGEVADPRAGGKSAYGKLACVSEQGLAARRRVGELTVEAVRPSFT